MIPAEPAGSAVPILSPMPDSSLRLANVPTIAPAAAPTATDGEQRGREQADEHADAAAPAGTLSAHVVAGVGDGDVAVRVVRDEDDPLDLDGSSC